jgi:hypothetical protein
VGSRAGLDAVVKIPSPSPGNRTLEPRSSSKKSKLQSWRNKVQIKFVSYRLICKSVKIKQHKNCLLFCMGVKFGLSP